MAENIINFFHLLGTAIWLGGAIFIQIILNPSIPLINPQESGKLMGIISKRFSIAAWISIIVLVTTGILKTPPDMYFETSSVMGIFLTIKQSLVIGVIILGLIIAFLIVPKLRRTSPRTGERPSDEFLRSSKKLHTVSLISTILGLGIIFCASFLW